MADDMRQYLTFSVADADFGVDIMDVREIKGWADVTRLPNTPEYLRGVMNLRGIIVPIFDLGCRFSGGLSEASASSVIIILSIDGRNIGMLVDAVSDILDIDADDIKPAPEGDGAVESRFVTGLISREERMVVVLDIARLFTAQDLSNTPQQAA